MRPDVVILGQFGTAHVLHELHICCPFPSSSCYEEEAFGSQLNLDPYTLFVGVNNGLTLARTHADGTAKKVSMNCWANTSCGHDTLAKVVFKCGKNLNVCAVLQEMLTKNRIFYGGDGSR